LNELVVIVIAAVIGSWARIIFGYLGESETAEDFSWAKAARSLARGLIGGIVIGVWCFYTQVITSPIGVFLAAFAGAITVDLVVKNITDAYRKSVGE
jgi:4-amino-4-deoxy-L-arabinose transferase-like glycosyltransferase